MSVFKKVLKERKKQMSRVCGEAQLTVKKKREREREREREA
jgi:hypothetical protein